MVKVIVTGIAGQIASEVARQCIEQKWQVIGIDNFSTGSEENIPNEEGIKIYRFDLQDIEALKEKDIDYIFHLGALADIVPSIENPTDYFNSNVIGTIRLMEYARKNNIKKVIYAASSSCYGIPKTFPTPETSPIDCKYPYSFTKWQAEEIIKHYADIYGIKYISLRLFNVYNPRTKISNNYGAVIKVFCKQYLDGYPLTIIGNGEQKRDFIHAKDVARAFVLSATSQKCNEIMNIGADRPITINYLAELIAGKDYPIEYLPWREGEPLITHAEITKAKLYLNWKPEITIEEGVKEILYNIENYRYAKLWTKDDILKKQEIWNNYLAKDK